jgi:hypothetical protein
MQRPFTNEEKAKLYNDMLFKHQRIQEEIRQIKAQNFEVSDQDQKKITFLEGRMKQIFNDTQRLYQ